MLSLDTQLYTRMHTVHDEYEGLYHKLVMCDIINMVNNFLSVIIVCHNYSEEELNKGGIM